MSILFSCRGFAKQTVFLPFQGCSFKENLSLRILGLAVRLKIYNDLGLHPFLEKIASNDPEYFYEWDLGVNHSTKDRMN